MSKVVQVKIFCVVIILFNLVSGKVYSQNGLFLLGGLEYSGATFNYRFQENKTILKRNWHGDFNFQIACNTNLHLRFAKYFGLETGLQLNEIDLIVNDHRFIQSSKIKTSNSNGSKNYNGGTSLVSNGNFDIIKWYLSPHIAGFFYFNLPSSNVHPFISCGITYNYLLSHPVKYSSFYYEPTQEDLQLTSHFSSFYKNKFLEAGVSIHNRSNLGGARYFIGLKYYFAGNIISGDYQDVQNGTVAYTDHVTASGSYLAFTFRVGGTLIKPKEHNKYKRRKNFRKARNSEKHKKVPHSEEKIIPEIKNPQNTPKPIIHSSDTIPLELEGRGVEVHKKINVKSQQITLKIWDHESIDGDVLSLNLNGNWILEDYTLQKEQKIIKENMMQGVNYLILFAKNEGRFKPCTSAILIEDGFSSQLVILNSDFGTSQAVQINVVK